MRFVNFTFIFTFLLLSCNESKKTETKTEEHTENTATTENFSFKTGYGDYAFTVNGVYLNDSTKIKVTHKGTDMEPGTFEVTILGRLKGAFSGDVSENYKPELYLWSRTDNDNQSKVLGFEFKSELKTLNFPPLTEQYAKGYNGKDTFYIKQEHFIRSFPLFEDKNGTLTITENRRTLWHTLNDSGTIILIN